MSERLKWPKERWFEELAAWRASGKSLAVYAREAGVSHFALRYWQRREPGSLPRPKSGPAAAGPKFIALKPARPANPGVEIRCGTFAVAAAVAPSFDSALLGAVLAVLQARP